MTILEKRQKRAAILKEAREILELANRENRENTPEEIAQWQAKQDEAKRMLAAIERQEQQAAVDAQDANAIGDQRTNPEPGARVEVSGQTAKRVKGQGFTNAVRAIGYGGRDKRLAARFAEETLHDPQLARALSASSAVAGGFAVPTDLSEEFIEFLRPASVVRSAGPRVLPMPHGNLSLPAITGGASASYIGENQNAVATQQVLGQVKLTAKKLAALVPISNDLIRYANAQTDAVIRQDLISAVAQAEDYNFLLGKGTAYSPKGMRFWAPSGSIFQYARVGGSSFDDTVSITSALATTISNLLTANVHVTRATGRFFMSQRTFVYLRTLRNTVTTEYAFPEMSLAEPELLGYKVSATSQMPITFGASGASSSSTGSDAEIYFANMPDMVIGESANLMLDVSSEAAYVDSNSNTISSFAQDQTIIRVIEENDFAVRYPLAISVMTAVTF